jgi:hypothetical protein
MAQRVYHRHESPTQTVADAAQQVSSGEMWGFPARWSDIPKVKAYEGPLPENARGIEFTTDVPPDQNCPPGRAYWSGPRAGVFVEGVRAKIAVVVVKNTQTQ